MAITTITGDLSVQQLVSSSDDLVIAPGATLTVNGSDAILGNVNGGTTLNGISVSVFGIVASTLDAIDFLASATDSTDDLSIFIGSGAFVFAGDQAIITQSGSGNSIVNHGDIVASGQVFVSDFSTSGGDFSLQNTGNMTSTGFVPTLDPGSNTDLFVINSGSIAQTGTGKAIEGDGGSSTLELVNSGTIVAANGVAVDWDATSSGTATIRNSGEITGDVWASFNDDVVTNSGVIYGDVRLYSGNDIYDGSASGIVYGTVLGGANNDTLRGSDEADRLDGGTDSDVIVGRGGDDVLIGDTGADTMRGGDGNDNINGGVNGDVINGNAGDDTIRGEGGDDALRGGRDDDLIEGGNGADTLRGDSGDDRIIGGAARDDMFGGSGRDVFVFEALSDSGTGAARDRIYDFQSGQDTLDISALAGPAFSYLGSSNFTSSGSPEVRAVSVANGTLIYIDANGDGTRDSDIYLIGTASVTEGDFLL